MVCFCWNDRRGGTTGKAKASGSVNITFTKHKSNGNKRLWFRVKLLEVVTPRSPSGGSQTSGTESLVTRSKILREWLKLNPVHCVISNYTYAHVTREQSNWCSGAVCYTRSDKCYTSSKMYSKLLTLKYATMLYFSYQFLHSWNFLPCKILKVNCSLHVTDHEKKIKPQRTSHVITNNSSWHHTAINITSWWEVSM